MGDSGGCGGTVETLDLRGLRCPLPALKTAARLRSLPPGARIEVLADDPLARLDLVHFCETEGHALVSTEAADDHFRFRIRRGGASAG